MRFRTLFCLLACTSWFAAATVRAQAPAAAPPAADGATADAAPADAKPHIVGYNGMAREDYDRMLTIAQVAPQRRKMVADILDEKEAALEAFDAKNFDTYTELRQVVADPKVHGTKADKAKADLRELLTNRAQVAKSFDNRALLLVPEPTKDQKVGDKLWRFLAPKFAKAYMTAEQDEDARLCCADAVRIVTNAPDSAKAVAQHAYEEIRSRILSQDQRDLMDGKANDTVAKAVQHRRSTSHQGKQTDFGFKGSPSDSDSKSSTSSGFSGEKSSSFK